MLPCVSRLVKEDYLKTWPALLPTLFHLLQTNKDVHVVIGALELFRCAIDVNNTSSKNSGHQTFTNGFPVILSVASDVLQNVCPSAGPTDPQCLVVKAILKVYLTAIQFVLPKDLQEKSSIELWMQLVLHILQMPHSSIALSTDPEDISVCSFFKMKKWGLHVLNRLFTRYGSDDDSKDKFRSASYADFSRLFMSTFALPALQVVLGLVHMVCSNQGLVLPDRTICLICDFLSSAILSNKLWKVIISSNCLELIIKLFIFPRLCFTDEDERILHDDPYEYVHKRLDPYEDFESMSWATSSLLTSMVKKRRKTVFYPVLSFVNDVFGGYSSSSSPYFQNVRAKEGGLLIIGSIASFVLNDLDVKGQVEGLVMTYILPETYSSSPFLRARACWAIQHFEDLRYTTIDNVVAVFKGILHCLSDTACLPVRAQAALALGVFLQFEEVTPMMTEHLTTIIQSLLDLTNQSDLDSLSYVFEKLVSLYSLELTPFAEQLCQQLASTLVRLLTDPKVAKAIDSDHQLQEDDIDGGSEDDFDAVTDKMMTAMGIMKTITTLIVAVKSNPQVHLSKLGT